MKVFTHPAVTALALTQIYLIAQIGQLLSPSHLVLYHWSGSAAAIFLSTILFYCLAWVTLTLLLLLARRPGLPAIVIWGLLLAAVPLQLVRSAALVSGKDLPAKLSLIIIGLTLATFVAAAILARRNLIHGFERARRVIGIILGFVAITSLVTLGQLLWVGWKARALNAALPLHQLRRPTAPKPRILWIVFDELSYQQVYGQRYPGLDLPAFDRLAAQSTVFTNTIPAGTKTEQVVPSLLTGWPVNNIRSSADGHQLSLHNPQSNTWQQFDPHQSVFADALNDGYSTALAGWYNPYCRIMPQVLDQCFWTFSSPSFGAMSPHLTIGENIWASVVRKVHSLPNSIDRLRNVPLYAPGDTMAHRLDYEQISAAADRLLNDPSATFIFLHMPVPHPGGIYNRTTSQFATKNSSYIDNLALADRCLSHVRSVLEQNGTWDSSTVVVMGDHSWRTFLWMTTPAWTPEDQRASHGGQYDPRPAYIVKLPNQRQPAHIGFPYAALHTRALMDALIAGQIHSPSDLSAWAGQWQQSAESKASASAQ